MAGPFMHQLNSPSTIYGYFHLLIIVYKWKICTLVIFCQEICGFEYEQLILFFWLVQTMLLNYGSRAGMFSL